MFGGVKNPSLVSLLFLFASAISFRGQNLRGFVAKWDTHLLSFVSFTATEHLTEV
jgi:hypothetical protein